MHMKKQLKVKYDDRRWIWLDLVVVRGCELQIDTEKEFIFLLRIS
jgi:hypothetical protein